MIRGAHRRGYSDEMWLWIGAITAVVLIAAVFIAALVVPAL